MLKVLVFICLVSTVVVFQNCGNKEFSLRTDLNKSSSIDGSEQLVTEDIPPAIVDQVNQEMDKETDDDDKDDYVKNEHTSGKKDDVKKDYTKSDDHDDKDYDDDDSKDYDDDDDKNYADKDKDKKRYPTSLEDKKSSGKSCKNRNDGNGRFVCVVAGPGKSQHIAVASSQIVEDNSTPKTACISQNACEKIIGAKIEVKSIENRGYCKNGTAHTVVLTDVEVQTLVDKLK
jgi:hypothetical protein